MAFRSWDEWICLDFCTLEHGVDGDSLDFSTITEIVYIIREKNLMYIVDQVLIRKV